MKIILKKIDDKFFNILSLTYYTLIDFKLFLTFYLNSFKTTKPSVNTPLIYKNEIDTLKLDGVVRIRNFFDLNIINKLEQDFNNLKKNYENLSKAKIDANISKKILDKQTFEKGEKYYKNLLTNIQIQDPLVKSPLLLQIALNQNFIDIAKMYFNTNNVFITGANYRRSYSNQLPANDTQLYHRDRNSFKILKFFIYLNDVDENSGPFQYILYSHKNWPIFSNRKYRWDDHYIESKFAPESIFSGTSSVGDVIIADTTGFHKGKKLNKKFRTMITFNYSTFAENGGNKVKIKDFEKYPFEITKEQKEILKYASIEY
jgi:ectoine hydroxylase-related dioxygenase (phytanoyl-CoA dioxygenase family)